MTHLRNEMISRDEAAASFFPARCRHRRSLRHQFAEYTNVAARAIVDRRFGVNISSFMRLRDFARVKRISRYVDNDEFTVNVITRAPVWVSDYERKRIYW